MSARKNAPGRTEDRGAAGSSRKNHSLVAVVLVAVACLIIGLLIGRSRTAPPASPGASETAAVTRSAESRPAPAAGPEAPRLPAGFDTLPATTTPQTFACCQNPKDAATLVWVPGTAGQTGPGTANGAFPMGSDPKDAFTNELPRHEVVLSGFWLYQDEVTNEQFARFAAALRSSVPTVVQSEIRAWAKRVKPGREKHPAGGLSWAACCAYAAGVNCRLPTEAQWEWAARGPSGFKYPWGNTWEARKSCNKEHTGDPTFPVGSFLAGASWCGALDMSGNVWEWCQDYYADKYQAERQTNPTGPTSGTTRVVRGGFWGTEQSVSQTTVRIGPPPDLKGVSPREGVGFRCVAEAG
jgi:formylglycine-generating enzyme required for sulfatase activity